MENKLFIRYLREEGVPFGVVVAIGPGELGWSMCSKKDQWNRKRGLIIAEGRATKGIIWRIHYMDHCPSGFKILRDMDDEPHDRWTDLYHTLLKVEKLSEQYFKVVI